MTLVIAVLTLARGDCSVLVIYNTWCRGGARCALLGGVELELGCFLLSQWPMREILL